MVSKIIGDWRLHLTCFCRNSNNGKGKILAAWTISPQNFTTLASKRGPKGFYEILLHLHPNGAPKVFCLCIFNWRISQGNGKWESNWASSGCDGGSNSCTHMFLTSWAIDSLLIKLQPEKVSGPYLHVFFKRRVKSKSKCQECKIK